MPFAHAVGVLEGVLLHWDGRPAVAVALPQHRIHRGAQDLREARLQHTPEREIEVSEIFVDFH